MEVNALPTFFGACFAAFLAALAKALASSLLKESGELADCWPMSDTAVQNLVFFVETVAPPGSAVARVNAPTTSTATPSAVNLRTVPRAVRTTPPELGCVPPPATHSLPPG